MRVRLPEPGPRATARDSRRLHHDSGIRGFVGAGSADRTFGSVGQTRPCLIQQPGFSHSDYIAGAMPNPEKPRRRSLRLTGYDYSQEGAYFVTICTYGREVIFEDTRYRKIVEKYWFDLPRHYPHVELDEFVVMPNHVHGIICLVGVGYDDRDTKLSRSDKPALPQSGTGAGSKSACSQPPRAALPVLRTAEPAPTNAITIQNVKRHSLAEVVRFFKTSSAREINRLRSTPGLPAWQRNYYEHIIRSEKSMNKIHEYIIANPLQWEFDLENPSLKTGVPNWKPGQMAEKEFWKKLKPVGRS